MFQTAKISENRWEMQKAPCRPNQPKGCHEQEVSLTLKGPAVVEANSRLTGLQLYTLPERSKRNAGGDLTELPAPGNTS